MNGIFKLNIFDFFISSVSVVYFGFGFGFRLRLIVSICGSNKFVLVAVIIIESGGFFLVVFG